MVIRLAENPNLSGPDFLHPTTRHITIRSQKNPSVPTAFCNYFGIVDILPFPKVIVMNHDTKNRFPQFGR
jgi:hypothetical protein